VPIDVDNIRAALAAHEPRDGDGDHSVGRAQNRSLTPKGDLRPAGVLVPLIERGADGTHVILTQRSHHLQQHAGQVSFPGGRYDATDPDLVSTALREAEEEIGLPSTNVTVLGSLNGYSTGTGYHITPVVGSISDQFQPLPNPGEVEDVFEVPLSVLMDEANYELRTGFWKGRERKYYALDYDNRFIWGATAGILVGMSRVLRTHADMPKEGTP